MNAKNEAILLSILYHENGIWAANCLSDYLEMKLQNRFFNPNYSF